MDANASRHPTDQALNAYGLGKLAEAAAGAVHAHLEACPACRVRVAELSSDSFLARLRDARGAPAAAGSGPGATQPHRPGAAGAAAPPQAGTLPPDLADHPDYEVRRELGRGGMGVVYLAHNRLMGRDEVLKVVSKHLIERRGVLDRFTREIRSAARLHHPNIVTAYAAFRSGESIVFAMEYVEGLDLAKMVKSRGPLPVANAAYYAHQVALGLQHAHERGMVHRDIKPGNLMLARRGDKATVKVLDFGLAKATREDPVDGGLTHQGQMLGTPDFIAPEQISDAQSADIRADIYSLGCTAYYLLSGGPPFRGVSLYDLLQAHHSMDARPLNLARTDVPVELAALVAKMMAKEPHRRFQEPAEVAEALKPFFKPGKWAAGVSRPGPNQASPSQAATETSRAISTPTQPATPPPPASLPEASPPPPELMWASLIDVKDSERSGGAKPARAIPRRQRPPWVLPAMAAGVLLCGLLLAWAAGVLRLKTADGVIVLENVPKDSEILIDGNKIELKWPGGGAPLEIRAVPGQRKVEVKKDGFKTFGEVVTVKADESEGVTVRLEPLGEEPSGKGEGIPEARTGASASGQPGPSTGRPSRAAGGSGATATSAASLAKAPPDSTLFEGDRYKAFHEELSWHEARDRCEAMGGHLAVVNGEDENRFLTSLASSAGLDAAWLGATDEQAEGRWVWVGGTEVRYENWDASAMQPNNRAPGGPAEHYMLTVVSRKGTWWDLPDRAEKQFHPGFLCEWGDNDAGSSNKRSGAGTIPGDARRFAGKLFKVFREEMSWQAARIRCEELGGSLAVVGDADENRFLMSLIAAEGLNEAWLGASDERAEGRWVWVDGTEMRYEAWDSGQPTNRSTWGSVEHYLLMAAARGGPWNDVPNGGERGSHPGFVCQWEAAVAPRAAAIGPAPAAPGPGTSKARDLGGFVPLFDGKDLAGWSVDSGPLDSWRVEGGELVMTGPGDWRKAGFLLSDREFSEFLLRLEFQMSPGANSGIAFWSFPGEFADRLPHPLQIDLFDRNRPNIQNAAFFWSTSTEPRDVAPPDHLFELKPSGAWNALEIEVAGDSLRVSVNDRVVSRKDLARLAARPGANPALGRRSGRIGLQSHSGTARFREIEVKALEPGPKPRRSGQSARPVDAKVLGGKAYRVFPEQVTWHEARARCAGLGGHLAVVTGEAENRFLTSLVKGRGLGGAWLGATDEQAEGRWLWVDGTPLRYSNWDLPNKQPNNKQGIEHYMVLLTRFDGSWCDQPDDGRQEHPGYVCQWD